MCAAFSFTSDLVLVLLGGKFKFREKLSGRLADALIHLYLGSAVLKRYEDDGRPEEDLPFVQWAMDDSLYTIQESLRGVLRNFPDSRLWFTGQVDHFSRSATPYSQPSDRLGKAIASLLLSENESRDRLTSGVYISDEDDASGKVHAAFHLVIKSDNAENCSPQCVERTSDVCTNYRQLVQKAVESGGDYRRTGHPGETGAWKPAGR